ncbi:MAG: protein of unknown function domain protein [Proteobacteria bacterium]|nr:protein of unknown function domain protein [Pseudomonadota bacterium]
MAFQQGLSGLNTSAKALDVTGNNIANSSTVGFKVGQAHFGDVYANSLAGGGAGQVGIGVNLAAVVQQFSQGNITSTNNPLDISINGGGFFRMDNNGAVSYTRNGQFHTDKDGYIINDQSLRLTGYQVDNSGNVVSAAPAPLQISSAQIAPRSTDDPIAGDIRAVINLDSRQSNPATAPFSSIDPESYNYTTSLSVYDTLGVPHTLTTYYVRTGAGAWEAYATLDGAAPAGAPVTPATARVTTSAPFTAGDYTLSGAAAQFTLTDDTGAILIDLSGTDWTGNEAGMVTAINTQLGLAGSNTLASYVGGALVFSSGETGSAAAQPAISIVGADLGGDGLNTFVNTGGANAFVTNPPFANMAFNNSGSMTSATINPVPGFALTTGAATPWSPGNIDFTGTTQYGSPSGVEELAQGGYTSGRLIGLSVTSDGMVQGRYSNGQTRNQGQVVLTGFTNPNGLSPQGNNQWIETAISGAPLVGAPNTASLGVLQSASVEESNVDLTAELVNMITQQRNYQANAQTIKTQDSIMNTLVNLR